MAESKHDDWARSQRSESDSLEPEDVEHIGLLSRISAKSLSSRERRYSAHIVALYVIIAALLTSGAASFGYRDRWCRDPSLTLYSPANEIIRYKTTTFESYFFEESPYTRASKEVKDKAWADLYEFGISGIPKEQADKLVNNTMAAPHDPDTYMIQLEVFHNIHCLNMLRKSMYPDQYPEIWSYWDNGTVNHYTLMAKHWDHCVDALLQTLMCNADVTPIVFENNFFGRGVFPKIVATHTCRDYDAISDWARAREVKDYEAN